MKSMSIDSSVLAGQGSIGSSGLTMSNPAPAEGPAAGVAASIGVTVPSSAAVAGALAPTDYPLSGVSDEPDSQYSTIGPVPEG